MHLWRLQRLLEAVSVVPRGLIVFPDLLRRVPHRQQFGVAEAILEIREERGGAAADGLR
jgi:hypothetical protein